MTSNTIDNNDGLNLEEIEQDVKKTTLGQWLLKNTQVVAISLITITVVAVGAVWFVSYQKTKKADSASLAFDFSQTTMKSFDEKKATADDVVTQYKELAGKIEHKASLIPLSLELSGKLAEQTKKMDHSITVLENTLDTAGSNTTGVELIRVQLASLYEDNTNTKKSIDTLESLKKTAPEYLGAYTYFNLGRLYKLEGDAVKAKEHLDHVIKKYEDSEEAKLAKILLTEL